MKETPSNKKTVQVASEWHHAIAKELEEPILPKELGEAEIERRKEEIDRQKERHQKFSRALRRLSKSVA